MRIFVRTLFIVSAALLCAPFSYALPEKDSMLQHRPSPYLEAMAPDRNVLKRGEALRALMEFFQVPIATKYAGSAPALKVYYRDVWPANGYYAYVNTACEKGVLNCTDNYKEFRADDPITLEVFFKIYYALKYHKERTDVIAEKYSMAGKPWYHPYITEAKTRGLIGFDREIGTLTHNELFYILYKEAILLSFMDVLPKYFVGLVLDKDEITTDRFYRLEEIEAVLARFDEFYAYADARREETTSTVEANRLFTAGERMKEYIAAYRAVYDEVNKNPLLYDPTLPDDIKVRVTELGLRDILGEGHYDYSHNAAYRKHNVTVSLEKFHNLVIQPGEEFNYWHEIWKKGLSNIKNGWLLVNNEEIWGFGGGLCGTATTVFRAAWHAGLDITERRQHSIYYRDLYKVDLVGLDAAVYQTGPNLRFKNTTESPILLVALFNENRDIARFLILGNKHYKNISFSGPFKEGRTYIRKRNIEFLNGMTREEDVRSTYGNM